MCASNRPEAATCMRGCVHVPAVWSAVSSDHAQGDASFCLTDCSLRFSCTAGYTQDTYGKLLAALCSTALIVAIATNNVNKPLLQRTLVRLKKKVYFSSYNTLWYEWRMTFIKVSGPGTVLAGVYSYHSVVFYAPHCPSMQAQEMCCTVVLNALVRNV